MLDIITVLADACKAGYVHDFLLDLSGTLYQFGKPCTQYGNTDFAVCKPIHCAESQATVYLLMTTSGIRGTWVDHWEHS
jgi:hypothetical protein